MKSHLFFLILFWALPVFGEESATPFVTITIKIPGKPRSRQDYRVTPGILYNWVVSGSQQNALSCNGGWTVSATALCKVRSAMVNCSAEQIGDIRATLNTAGVQVSLVKRDSSTLDITNFITSLCLQDGCQYISNPPFTDSIQFFGIGNLNPFVCNSAAITQQGGSWNVAFDYKLCQNVPKWLTPFYEGENLIFAQHLLKGASAVNIVDCSTFKNVDILTVAFTAS